MGSFESSTDASFEILRENVTKPGHDARTRVVGAMMQIIGGQTDRSPEGLTKAFASVGEYIAKQCESEEQFATAETHIEDAFYELAFGVEGGTPQRVNALKNNFDAIRAQHKHRKLLDKELEDLDLSEAVREALGQDLPTDERLRAAIKAAGSDTSQIDMLVRADLRTRIAPEMQKACQFLEARVAIKEDAYYPAQVNVFKSIVTRIHELNSASPGGEDLIADVIKDYIEVTPTVVNDIQALNTFLTYPREGVAGTIQQMTHAIVENAPSQPMEKPSRPLRRIYIEPAFTKGVTPDPIVIDYDPSLVGEKSVIQQFFSDQATKYGQTFAVKYQNFGMLRYRAVHRPEGEIASVEMKSLNKRGYVTPVVDSKVRAHYAETVEETKENFFIMQAEGRSAYSGKKKAPRLPELKQRVRYETLAHKDALDAEGLHENDERILIDPGHIFSDDAHDAAAKAKHQAIMGHLLNRTKRDRKVSKYEDYKVNLDGRMVTIRVTNSLVRTPGKKPEEETVRVMGRTLGRGGFGKVVATTVRYKACGEKDGQTLYEQKETSENVPKVIKMQKYNQGNKFDDWTKLVINELGLMRDTSDGKIRPAVLFNDAMYTVSEMYEGRSGGEYFKESEKDYSTRDKVAIFRDFCGGIADLHAKGIFHRDVKGENIVINDAHGEAAVKIIDLGLGVRGDDESELGRAVGTPLTTAPEVFDGQGTKSTSDTYSCGITILQLLTEDYGATFRVRDAKHVDNITDDMKKWSPSKAEIKELIADYVDDEASQDALSELLEGMLKSDPNKRIEIAEAHSRLESIVASMDARYDENPELSSLQPRNYVPEALLAERPELQAPFVDTEAMLEAQAMGEPASPSMRWAPVPEGEMGAPPPPSMGEIPLPPPPSKGAIEQDPVISKNLDNVSWLLKRLPKSDEVALVVDDLEQNELNSNNPERDTEKNCQKILDKLNHASSVGGSLTKIGASSERIIEDISIILKNPTKAAARASRASKELSKKIEARQEENARANGAKTDSSLKPGGGGLE